MDIDVLKILMQFMKFPFCDLKVQTVCTVLYGLCGLKKQIWAIVLN
jgi:hypothetical protein